MSKSLKIVAVIALVLGSLAGAKVKSMERPATVAVCCGIPWCPPGSPCPVKN